MNSPRIIPSRGLFGGRLLAFNELPSTNAWALANTATCEHGDVVWTARQTAGRGRFERAWMSPADCGLALSVVLKPPQLQERALPVLTPAAAVAVARLLEHDGIASELKWPNDVLARGGKIAGILAERDTATAAVVLGIGVNVNLTERQLTERGLPHRATSMLIESGRARPVPEVRDALLDRMSDVLAHALAGRDIALRSEWAGRDALAGRIITVRTVNGALRGEVRGIDAEWRLVVRDAAGVDRAFWSGDVTLAC